jgi:hypothetical protein
MVSENGFGAASMDVWVPDAPRNCPNQIPIFPHNGLEVNDYAVPVVAQFRIHTG